MATPIQTLDPELERRLEQLAVSIEQRVHSGNGDNQCWAVVAKQRRVGPPCRDEELSFAALDRAAEQPDPLRSVPAGEGGKFVPRAPASLKEAGLTESEVEALILKFLLNRGTATGAAISSQIALPFGLLERELHSLKTEQLVTFKGSAKLNDYLYELTESGADRARRHARQCTYFGAAPVALEHYVAGVMAQSLQRISPRLEDIRRAFSDLYLSEEMLKRVGRAVAFGKGLFLYGAAGNGKTCIAERVTRAYGGSIWIPRAISAWGEIIRLYDPGNHEELSMVAADNVAADEMIDNRWVRIRRPTVIVGGELTMDNLEIRTDKPTGIAEAPLQLKSNCGTLVIDDFGRQRISPAELLNRWIVPLEKRHDYLSLASGRRIQVPFDQFIVFSTNLDPSDLVDEAFLRRIPYKILAEDPTEAEFRGILEQLCGKMGIEYSADAVDHLVEVHYQRAGRKMRFCHPRDLVQQVETFCRFEKLSLRLTADALDAAAHQYFSVIQ
jgi:predicted ATPase with chaperone activity